MVANPSPRELARHVPLPGTFNMRDIGGYLASRGITQWRMLLRADALHRLDDEGRRTLSELGIRTIVDLRGDNEVAAAPNRLGSLNVRSVRQPLLPTRANASGSGTPPLSLSEIYAHVVDQRPQALVSAVRELALEDALPAIVHCTMGKDRTGMVVAVVLALVGVDDETIVSDYAETERVLRGPFRADLVASHLERGLSIERIETLLMVDPSAIRTFLERIRASYGSVPEFLSRYGMSDEELARLASRLVVEDSSKPN